MKIAFFSSALLFTSTAMSAIPINGCYSSIFGGINYIFDNLSVRQDNLISTYSFYPTISNLALTNASYEPGYDVGLRFGFQNNAIRYEAELTYLNADVERFYINKLRQSRVNGETDAIFAMGNIYYDFPDMVEAISPFLGVGLGYGWIEGKFNTRSFYYSPHAFPSFNAVDYQGSNSVFAYQVTAGFTYNYAENYALNLAYRYIGTDRVEALGKVFQANLVTVGLLYRFNENNYK
ncbi:opacity protein-like surface antigen [Legionella busanensis]|uniref:Opacity protein-like surface antigen n=1 Tax=Legionella busanensis TaxID=190655 RepID=A0A378JSN8_9GAMM|nr:outer membrane beta-barrel protein [Legionella busanensis]STX51182.1 opacity protein-like surface antigen [Legionella busanensis]